MTIRSKNVFTTVRTEGAILPADLLQRIVEGSKDLEGLSPTSYHLLEGEKLNEAINRSWTRLRGAWASFKMALEKLPPNDPGTSVTRDRFLLPLFQELGYGRLTAAKALEVESRGYPISHGWLHTPIHLVGWRVDLDRRTAGVAGAARSSPHSLVQELLNRSQGHLWALLSNGRQLRILRDNVSLTRQAYVEFDLEAMMLGEVYSDFVLLWLLCHQSRVEAEKPEQCWLEKWSKTAQEQGTRALDQLRRGVEVAIAALGQGFLSHVANRELRQQLQSGALSTQDYYRQLLRLVYRLLFLFVAEDRGFLLDPKADLAARERYTLYYSTVRLRSLAEKRRGTRHADLFFGLRLVMEKLGSSEGCRELGLPALGSLLWSEAFVADVVSCQLANTDLLAAIRALAFITDKHGRRPVDYKNLRSEELGSVYEALLELHPELNVSAGTFGLTTAAGNERKTTGSYYTPESLVQCLLDSALDPVVDEAVQQADPEAAILNLKVCDPACGSGHFLIAAAHRMAKRLAGIRTGEEEPSPEATQKALRDVIGRCIYGVDVNPMAVELCKVALWMESLEPGKPLSFLEHHIQCGNSLLGATPALLRKGIPDEAFTAIEGDDKAYCSKYKKLNKEERSGQLKLFDANFEPWQRLGDLATSLVSLDQIADDSIEGIQRKQEQYESLVKSTPYLFSRFWADAWCAAFVWKKTQEFPYPITDEVFRRIERNPHSVEKWMRDEVMRLTEQYEFFHWHLVFPDVFRVDQNGEPENEQTGWNGGFDIVLGNPPWDQMQFREQEFFSTSRSDIAHAATGNTRKRMIQKLEQEDPSLYKAFTVARRKVDGTRYFVQQSRRFILTGRGRINDYALFAETMRLVLNRLGRVGCIVPSGIATDDSTKYFFQALTQSQSLASLYDFENRDEIFLGVHRSYKFCLLTFSNCRIQADSKFIFFAYQIENINDKERSFTLSPDDIALLNPNTFTCPIFRSTRDAEITKAIYRRIPVLIRDDISDGNRWEILTKPGLFNMTGDSNLFRTKEILEKEGWQLENNVFTLEDQKYLPLYEGKMFHFYDHRAAGVVINSDAKFQQGQAKDLSSEEHMSPWTLPYPRYWIPDLEIEKQLRNQWTRKWLIGWREVARSTDERTLIPGIFPRVGLGHKIPTIIVGRQYELFAPLLVSCLASFICDFVARQKLGGVSFTPFTFKQLPVIAPATYNQQCVWFSNIALQNWLLPRVLELTYTAWDLQPFAQDCGYDGAPFRWDENRRFLLRCELDAAYFHLYGIQRDDVDYIMETFPIVKRKDEKAYGHYRTKDQILEIYDAMAEAMKEQRSYQTLLDPPPAHPSAAHPGERS
ncbi:Eco57I restriction-modification methylase domain-containing protein [Leptolyngbya sp. AN03gr2]|uniref:Eco57I restriction-modification methylase domain-containing protein n=1 Tax=unclassified Leptolyngbya TaxID=2650499 RepID=UPI003D31BF82